MSNPFLKKKKFISGWSTEATGVPTARRPTLLTSHWPQTGVGQFGQPPLSNAYPLRKTQPLLEQRALNAATALPSHATALPSHAEFF